MKQVLVPMDFSENALNALTYGRTLFEKISVTFQLLSIYENPTDSYYDGKWLDSWSEEVTLDLKKWLKALNKGNENPKHHFNIHSKPDTLLDAMHAVVEKMAIEVILMPAKDNKAGKDTFLNADAVDVIGRFRNIPIMVVPGSSKIRRPKEIVFSTNFKRAFDRRELDVLILLGKSLRCQIRVVQIMSDRRLDEFQRANKEYLQEILNGIECSFEKIDVKTNETDAINDFVKKMESDMISMVNHRHNFLQKLTQEDVVKKVVFNSIVPLLIMPELVKSEAKRK